MLIMSTFLGGGGGQGLLLSFALSCTQSLYLGDYSTMAVVLVSLLFFLLFVFDLFD